ncbi:MAG: hypothetical protein ACKO23_11510 [Gemmataceae bacterium]
MDAYHGHKHATTEFPNGIYHYHITDDSQEPDQALWPTLCLEPFVMFSSRGIRMA